MGVRFVDKSLKTSPVRFKMVAHLNVQVISKFSAWKILSKRFNVSPEACRKCRRLWEHLASPVSGLLEVTSGHLHLICFSLDDIWKRKPGKRKMMLYLPIPNIRLSLAYTLFSIQLSNFKHGRGEASKYIQISCWAPNAKRGRPQKFHKNKAYQGVYSLTVKSQFGGEPKLKIQNI